RSKECHGDHHDRRDQGFAPRWPGDAGGFRPNLLKEREWIEISRRHGLPVIFAAWSRLLSANESSRCAVSTRLRCAKPSSSTHRVIRWDVIEWIPLSCKR